MDKISFKTLFIIFMVLLSFQLAEAAIATPLQPQASHGISILNNQTKVTWNIHVENPNNVWIIKTISIMRNQGWRPKTRVTIALVKTTPRILRKTVTTTNLRTPTQRTTIHIITNLNALQYIISNFRMIIRNLET